MQSGAEGVEVSEPRADWDAAFAEPIASRDERIRVLEETVARLRMAFSGETDWERALRYSAALEEIRRKATTPTPYYGGSWSRQQWAADIVDNALGDMVAEPFTYAP
jgi:hypothetical protein